MGKLATFECGLTGGLANRRLARFGRKLGPSPASINSARISGIVANNASGSSYGIKYNSYNTIRGMRLVMADGTILDTRKKKALMPSANRMQPCSAPFCNCQKREGQSGHARKDQAQIPAEKHLRLWRQFADRF
jgi:hypothetical protein